jgi:hypothetical protein
LWSAHHIAISRFRPKGTGNIPFLDSKPIHLIVIAPSFHEDNYIQRKYTSLDIDFLQFHIIEDNEENYFELLDNNKNIIDRVLIPAKEDFSEKIIIQEPTKKLSLILSKLEEQEKETLKKSENIS